MSEIIIDGVDVSECRYYHYKGCPARGTKCDFESSECYYKQLKRLQAENYELKESLKVFNKPDVKKVLTLYNCGEIERLEQENERLLNLQCKFKEYCTCDTEKYKQALEEIREITIKNCDYRKNNDNCINSGCSKNYKNCTGYKILTKINEVLKDER